MPITHRGQRVKGFVTDGKTVTARSYYNMFNPLTPRSDSYETSACDVHTLSSKQVIRILKLIR